MSPDLVDTTIRNLVKAVRQALNQNNWYAALALSLTLPDICGSLQYPDVRGKQRYIDWTNKHLKPRYTSQLPMGEHVFLEGADLYALRCAVLHEGTDDLAHHQVRVALNKFLFLSPNSRGIFLHKCQDGALLQLDVIAFCTDVCDVVSLWLREAYQDPAIKAKIDSLMRIRSIDEGSISF